MGDKFSWDRLLKRTKDAEVDNTIEMVTDQPSGPVAPLRAASQPPMQKAVPDAPPVQTSQQNANRAPLVIEWDEFQQTDESSAFAPIDVPPEKPTAEQTAPPAQMSAPTPPVNHQPIEAPNKPATENFWERLSQDTQSALGGESVQQSGTPVVTGWDDVELTPNDKISAPVAPAKPSESDMMAGTIDPDYYQPINNTYQRPSEEEIKQKTSEIAQSSAWDETPAPQAPAPTPVPPTAQEIESPFSTPVAETPNSFETALPPVVESVNKVTPPEEFSTPKPYEPDLPPVQNFVPGGTAEDTYQVPHTVEPELPPVVQEYVAPPVFEAPAEIVTPVEAELPPVAKEVSAPPMFESVEEVPAPVEAELPPLTQEVSAPPMFESVEEVPAPVEAELPSAFETVDEAPAPIQVEESVQEFVAPIEEVPAYAPIETSTYQEPIEELVQEPVKVQATPEDFWSNIPGASVPKAEEPVARAINEQPAVAAAPPVANEPTAVPAEYTKIDESEAPRQVEKEIRVGDVLLKHKLVAPAQLERALARQQESNEKLGQVLISMGLISERRLLQVLASQKGVSPWHLEDDAPSQDALGLVSHETCQLFQVLPVAVRGDLLLLAMRDTQDHEAIEAIRSASGKRVEPVLADEARLSFTIDQAFGVVRERHTSAVEEMVAIAHEQEVNLSDGTVVNPERPDHLTALLRELIVDARRKDATSITIADKDGTGEILYRIHGRLCPVQQVPHSLALSVLEHAQSDLEQERLPFAIEAGYKVAISSGQNGDQFLVTFPQAEKEIVPLHNLGIESENLKLLREINERPYGLFLITGSARSAKQVTLASLAQELEKQGRVVARASEGENIAEQIGMAVTSESEVIVVGELDRDDDIKAAVKAASSGHLILAEVTANDAPTAIQQLISCGADPYLLATILTGVWCQAIAPKLCLNCRQGQNLTDVQREILDQYGMRHIQKVFESTGCESCNHTSVSGQIVLSEVLPVSSDVSHMIAEKAPVEKIAEQAGFAGYLPMDYDAMTRIIHGDVDFTTAKKLVFFKQRELAAISRRDTWETQAS